jgi:hypothetical protein
MFIGHFALAFAAKKVTPNVSLGTLFAAVQFADLLWPTLVLTGVEQVAIRPGITAVTPLDFVHYPWSHSFVALLAWAAVCAVAYRFVRHGAWPAAIAIGALVLSHWVLDVASHRPDMPLTITGPERLGLGLWNSVSATLLVEGLMFGVGLLLYHRATIAVDPIGRAGLWSLVAFLAVVCLASVFGPPPPSTTAVAWSVQAIWILVAWAWWVDRHRRPRAPADRAGSIVP